MKVAFSIFFSRFSASILPQGSQKLLKMAQLADAQEKQLLATRCRRQAGTELNVFNVMRVEALRPAEMKAESYKAFECIGKHLSHFSLDFV